MENAQCSNIHHGECNYTEHSPCNSAGKFYVLEQRAFPNRVGSPGPGRLPLTG